jgi:hypothetical protein
MTAHMYRLSYLHFIITALCVIILRCTDNTETDLEEPGQIIFEEDFEGGDYEDWFDAYGPPEIIDNTSTAHSGSHALKCTAVYNDGDASTSSIKYWFHPGHDRVHFRWYCKFDSSFDQGWGMHFCSLYAVAGDNKWNQMGQAGIKPDGDDRFGSGFEPWSEWETITPPGQMQFYVYWHEMLPDNSGNYWGNVFCPDTVIIPERDRWYCMELMIKANDAGQANGELAAWIDGELYMHIPGFNWRTTDELKIKRISLGIYIHNNPKDNICWFDDVVLSTGYIGP